MDGNGLDTEVLMYYTDIFAIVSPNVSIFHNVHSRIIEEMNIRLLRPFTTEEVKLALFDMALEKAPGPDGMTPTFYQCF